MADSPDPRVKKSGTRRRTRAKKSGSYRSKKKNLPPLSDDEVDLLFNETKHQPRITLQPTPQNFDVQSGILPGQASGAVRNDNSEKIKCAGHNDTAHRKKKKGKKTEKNNNSQNDARNPIQIRTPTCSTNVPDVETRLNKFSHSCNDMLMRKVVTSGDQAVTDKVRAPVLIMSYPVVEEHEDDNKTTTQASEAHSGPPHSRTQTNIVSSNLCGKIGDDIVKVKLTWPSGGGKYEDGKSAQECLNSLMKEADTKSKARILLCSRPTIGQKSEPQPSSPTRLRGGGNSRLTIMPSFMGLRSRFRSSNKPEASIGPVSEPEIVARGYESPLVGQMSFEVANSNDFASAVHEAGSRKNSGDRCIQTIDGAAANTSPLPTMQAAGESSTKNADSSLQIPVLIGVTNGSTISVNTATNSDTIGLCPTYSTVEAQPRRPPAVIEDQSTASSETEQRGEVDERPHILIWPAGISEWLKSDTASQSQVVQPVIAEQQANTDRPEVMASVEDSSNNVRVVLERPQYDGHARANAFYFLLSAENDLQLYINKKTGHVSSDSSVIDDSEDYELLRNLTQSISDSRSYILNVENLACYKCVGEMKRTPREVFRKRVCSTMKFKSMGSHVSGTRYHINCMHNPDGQRFFEGLGRTDAARIRKLRLVLEKHTSPDPEVLASTVDMLIKYMPSLFDISIEFPKTLDGSAVEDGLVAGRIVDSMKRLERQLPRGQRLRPVGSGILNHELVSQKWNTVKRTWDQL